MNEAGSRFSPPGETQSVRRPSAQGARRSANSGTPRPYILEPYVEHGEQAKPSNGGPMACFPRQVMRNAD